MDNTIKEELEILNQQIKELDGIYREKVSLSGISTNEFWIWYALVIMNGEYSQQDICSIWALPKQTVNNITTQMVKKGFATLEVVPGTKNRKIIRLTEAGRNYGEGIVRPIAKMEQKAFEKLSVEERNAFSNVLGKYIDIIKEELNKE